MKWLLSKTKGDVWIWSVVGMLTMISVLAVYSSIGILAYQKGTSTFYYLAKHTMMIAAGLVLMYYTHKLPYKWYAGISRIAIVVALALLGLTYFIGVEINDAQRWIAIPGLGITFQPSDFARLALFMFLARQLSKKQETIKDFRKGFLPVFGAVMGVFVLIAPANLSNALMIFGTSMLLMLIGRVSFKQMAMVCGAGLLVLTMVVFFGPRRGVYMNRICAHSPALCDQFNIEHKVKVDDTYQADQAKVAIATGGVFGKGPGNSTQRNFLPSPYADFIFAIIIEEYGIAGAVILILLYLIFLFRSVRIVTRAPKAFGALLATALSFSLVVQAFSNMAVATGLFPVTGAALPLVSMGGTSILFTSIAFGIILSVSRDIEEMEKGAENDLA